MTHWLGACLFVAPSSVFDYIDSKISNEAPAGYMSLSDLKKAFAFLGFDVRRPLVVQAMESIGEYKPTDSQPASQRSFNTLRIIQLD